MKHVLFIFASAWLALSGLAAIPSTVQVSAPVAPSATNSPYGAQVPRYGYGGLLTGGSLAEYQNPLWYPTARRHAGMLAISTNSLTYYQLGTNLTTWVNANPILASGGYGTNTSLLGVSYAADMTADSLFLTYTGLSDPTNRAAPISYVNRMSPLVVGNITNLLQSASTTTGRSGWVLTNYLAAQYTSQWLWCPDLTTPDNGRNIRRPNDKPTDADPGRWQAIPVEGDFSVLNFAALLSIINPSPLLTVTVMGYYAPGDGGGATYFVTNTITGTNVYGGRVVTYNGTNSWQLVHSDVLQAASFGATAGTGSKLTQLQAAIDYGTALPGGITVQMPKGAVEVNGAVVLKKGVWLEGASEGHYVENDSFDSTSPQYIGGYASCLFGQANINTNVITWDISTGAIRGNTSTTWDGVTSTNAAFMYSGVRNLIIKRASTQTQYEPLLFAENCWAISVERCTFSQGASQFLAHFRNCNALLFRENNSTTPGRGYLFDDCADSQISGNLTYGSIGPVYTFLASWKNGIVNNFAGNALTASGSWNSRIPATVSGDTFTCTNHMYSTGSLVYIGSTGTLPSPLVDTRPYWAIKTGVNTFKVATNPPAAYAGTAVTLTTAGSGTITPSTGPCAGMFFVGAGGNPGRTPVVGNKIDQCYESGIELWGWNSTTFSGNSVVECSFGNASQFPAFAISKGSTYNVFDGTTTDTISSCSYIYDVAANCDNNEFGQMKGTYSVAETRINATGNSNNRTAVRAGINGEITTGTSSAQTTLALTGNASGVRILTMERPGLGKIGLGVSANFWNFYNETAGRAMASLADSGSQVIYQLGASAAASPRSGVLQGEGASGTNVVGGDVSILAGPGTGNSASSDIIFQVPQAGASGSTLQASYGTRLQIDQPASPSTGDTAVFIFWWDGAAWVAARVTVGGPGTGPGGSGRALYLP